MASNSVEDDLYRLIYEKAAQELEQLISEGDDRACETLFAKYPELQSDHDRILEMVYLEHVIRQEHGKSQDTDEFVARFPAIEADLRKLAQVDQAMRQPASKFDDTLSNKAFETLQGQADFTDAASQQIGNYTIIEIIGRGGMGVVFKAKQNRLDRIVAVKTLDTLSSFNPSTVARFRLEAELSARVQHPNIIPIHEIGMHQGVPFFSMEYISGGTLAQALRDRPLSAQTAARLVETLAIAVQYAHEQGVIHRDLKPSNILLEPSQRPEALSLQSHVDLKSEANDSVPIRLEPKIADFGLAKFLNSDSQRTRTGATLGTPSYMAPEQADATIGIVSAASDVYSLGAILYDALVGRPPFHAATVMETLHQVLHDEPIALHKLQAKVPADLETICLRCLEKEPQRRYRSAIELADDLRRFLDGKTIHARAAGPLEKTYKWVHRNPSLSGLIAAMLFAAIGMSWLWWLAISSSRAEHAERMKGERVEYDRLISLAQFEYESENVQRCRDLLAQCDPAFRHWEWDYLDKLAHDAIWESPRMSMPAVATAISPDGKNVAGGYGIWGVNQADAIRVWDIETGELKWKLEGHPSSVHGLDFSPDGTMLASSGAVWGKSQNGNGGLFLWNLLDGTKKFSLEHFDGHVVQFSPDGISIFVGQTKSTIHQISVETGEELRLFKGLSNFVPDIDLSPDGRQLAAVCRDGKLMVWDVESSQMVYFLSGLGDPRRIRWSPDGKHLFVGHYTGQIQKFAIRPTQLELVDVDTHASLPYFAITPDGQYELLAAFGDGAQLRDLKTGAIARRFRGPSGHIRSLAMDRRGKRVAFGYTDGSICAWDLQHEPLDLQPAYSKGARIVSIAPDPTKPQFALAMGFNDRFWEEYSGVPRIEIWDEKSMKKKKQLTGHTGWLTSIDYRPDGQQMVSGSLDKTLRVWDLTTKNESFLLEGHTTAILQTSYLKDPRELISFDNDGEVKIWNLDRRVVEHGWNLGTNDIQAVAVCAKANVAAIAYNTIELSLWNCQTDKKIASLRSEQNITSLVLSTDGKLLAAGTKIGAIDVWNLSDLLSMGKSAPKVTLKGHASEVTSLSFSEDDQRLVAGSRDESVRMFDVISGCELLCLNTKETENIVKFDSGGTKILRAEYQTLRKWGIDHHSRNLSVSDSEQARQSDIAWHRSQLNMASSNQNWHALIFHYSELIALVPNDSNYYYLRAHTLIGIGDWEHAESDLRHALELKDSPLYRSYLARICFKFGRMDEYREHCRKVWESIRASKDNWSINGGIWTICLSEEPVVAPSEMLPVMISVSKRSPATKYDNTLAFLLYRAGRYDEANQLAVHSLQKNATENAPFDWMVLALCQSKQTLTRTNERSETNNLLNLGMQPIVETVSLPQPTYQFSEKQKSPLYWNAKTEVWLADQEKKLGLGQLVSSYYQHKKELDIQLLQQESARLVDLLRSDQNSTAVAK